MYKTIVDPILNRLDSETIHIMVKKALKFAGTTPLLLSLLEVVLSGKRVSDKRLRVNLSGIKFDNPVMVGAGWDKTGEALIALYHLGFAGIEVGTVLLHPQPGNPKPRQFVIGKGVALNRLGFNSPGADVVVKNLKKYKNSRIPIGISVGKNKDVPDSKAAEAHAQVVKKLYPFASYFAINVSSPNTPGLRKLQDKKPLTEIVKAINKAMDEMGGRKPTFVKIAPDLTKTAVDDVIDVALSNKLAGIIATNTTIRSDLKAKYGSRFANEAGGLSGDDPEFRRMSTEKIAYIYKKAGGKLEIIGVGGVKDAETAMEKIMAGASLIQVVTGIRGEGLSIANRINRGLIMMMDNMKVKNISELIGKSVKINVVLR